MAEEKRRRRDRMLPDYDDVLQIRAKGQYLRVSKEPGKDNFDRPSGADNLSSHPRRKKKVLSRKGQRKNTRSEKKAKRHEFYKKGKLASRIQIENTLQGQDSSNNKNYKSSTQNTNKLRNDKKKAKSPIRDVKRQRYNEENKKEDKEIKRLEKLLNMGNKQKLPSQFMADGLDYILEVCDHDRFTITVESDQESDCIVDKYTKSVNTNNEVKTTKEKSLEQSELDKLEIESNRDKQDEIMDDDIGADYDNDCEVDDGGSSTDNDTRDDANHINSNDEPEQEFVSSDGRSDPIKNPWTEITKDFSAAKYIPPHLRNQDNHDHLVRLNKQLKGLLNKLSEGNLQLICSAIEELFSKHSRNEMNELLTKIILESCVSHSLMPSKFLMEHCLLVAVLNSNIGIEIGAHFTQMLAELFDSFHKGDKCTGNGKKLLNVVSLFSYLYNFKVIHCGLIYDIIRRLTERFEEQDIEQLLLILKSTGADIRRDDPGSLKDIILELQLKAASACDLSNDSRVKFMLEIIANIRNNNLRKIPGYDPSEVNHLRKLLGSTVRNSGRASSSQLQVSMEDLLQDGTKGRWWIVGSAWSGRSENNKTSTSTLQWSSQLLELACKQGMNTDVRRTIFCVMMTSEDYADAFEKLLKLKLKDIQAREIIHVLIDCCLKEKSFNHFYAYLGQKFCEYNRSFQVTFQFSLWDKFKVIESLKPNCVHNMTLILGHLVASKALSLSVLKVVDFTNLERPSIRFFKQFFTHFLAEYPSEIVRKSFERISTIPGLLHLRQGMAIFIRHFMLNKQAQDNENIRSIIGLLQPSKDSNMSGSGL